MAAYKGSSSDGLRARDLEKARKKQQEEFERVKARLKEDSSKGLRDMDAMFQTHDARGEALFKQNTVGLVSADRWRELREQSERLDELEAKRLEARKDEERRKRARERERAAASLSFALEEEEQEQEQEEQEAAAAEGANGVAREEDVRGAVQKEADAEAEADAEPAAKRPHTADESERRFGKDPTANTEFLPDKEREAEEARLRAELAAEFKAKQEQVKKEEIEVVYSYWDGAGHRRSIRVKKGTTIGGFLELVRRELVESFPEVKGVSAENLLYIKEDVIIPHSYSFYELIVSRARGKSGPLFYFDVHDDVRLMQDARVEKEESHAGKVVLRAWYERNKHIFPASRWEVYDPTKSYSKYTIKGD
jgi:protein FAM50